MTGATPGSFNKLIMMRPAGVSR